MMTLWVETSKSNSSIFDDVFRLPPCDQVTSYSDLNKYQDEQEPLAKTELLEAIEELEGIQGVLIDFPTKFLENEAFSKNDLPLQSKEFNLPWNIFL